MTPKGYDLKAQVLSRKYTRILQDFEEARDDRRIAWNCYQQLIAACGAMRDNNVDNNFICCAVNARMKEQEATIDSIITRFTGLEYRDNEWTEPLGTGLYFEVYRESTEEGVDDVRIKSTRDGELAFRLARETEEAVGIGHYILIVTPSGQTIKTNDF